jgi:translation initiation factor 2A
MDEEREVRSSPPCRLLVRTKTNVTVYQVPERADEDPQPHREATYELWKGATTWSHCSPDGAFVYLLTNRGVARCCIRTKESGTIDGTKAVQIMSLSPSGAFFVTWERLSDASPQNLKLFKGGNLLTAFSQKALKRDAWPTLQFTHDERYAFLLTTSEIRVYPVESLSDAEPRYVTKLHVPGLSSFSLPSRCGKKSYFFTTFCAGSKNQPAKASLQEFRPDANEFHQRSAKSLFQAEEMRTHWSPLGDSALITLQTSVDTSGQSYYGSSQLFLLSPTADVLAVPVSTPVLDVSWMPHPEKPPCFVVIAGKMPALASLHHGQTADQLFLFGNAHRNVVAWSPHGRFVTLAGFGNLAGGMGFWDRNKLKLVPHSARNASGELKAEHATAHGWSPDSRLFVTATCSPRMNVENGIRLWRYTGEELSNVPWNNVQFQPDQLLQAQFIPAVLDDYPDRPQSPLTGAPKDNAAASPAAYPTKAKPAAYVPPSARNRPLGAGTSLAEKMRREKEASTQVATRVVSTNRVASAGSANPLPVGMTVAPKSKSAIKREKLKAKKQEEEQQHVNVPPPSSTNLEVERKDVPTEDAAVDPEKKSRKLKKILKQIQDLKDRDIADLNDDQRLKLASEAAVRAELAELGL